jgi:DinB superfamily
MKMSTATTAAPEQKLGAAEIEQGRGYLEQTLLLVVGATKGLSGAQWDFKPSPEQWSLAQTLEHIVVVQEVIIGRVRDQLPSAPPPMEHDTQQVDAIVVYHFAGRLMKFKGPEVVMPASRWTPDQALDRFLENSATLNQLLASTPGLRAHGLDSPPLKAVTQGKHQVMDGYQWILAAGSHTERHVKQMLEVKAHADFPHN